MTSTSSWPSSNGGSTSFPTYENQGTTQPKVDGRLDYSLDNGSYMTFSGGYAGTEGIMHSGIGPFDIESGTWTAYGKANYTKNAFRLQAFYNTLDGDAAQLLTRGPGGAPIVFLFKTKTFDVEAGNVTTFGRNVLTYGGKEVALIRRAADLLDDAYLEAFITGKDAGLAITRGASARRRPGDPPLAALGDVE